MINKKFITVGELEKMLYLISNCIDWDILGQEEMKFQKSFKFYSNDQWLLHREQTWFNMVNILYTLMLNQKKHENKTASLVIIIIIRKKILKGEGNYCSSS